MEAAALCKMRGHDVALYERESALGGQWKVACTLPGKEGYFSLIQNLTDKLARLQVPIRLNTLVSRQLVEEIKPDIAVVATGAVPLGLNIPGADEKNYVQANDIITGKVKANGRVIVIGGNMVGMEVALSLAQQGRTVSLVSHSGLGGRKGPDDMITFRGLLRRISIFNIPQYLNSEIMETCDNSLMIRFEQELISLPFDTLVVAIGVRANDGLIAELKGLVPEIYPIGDCVMPGNAAQATYSAARLALKL